MMRNTIVTAAVFVFLVLAPLAAQERPTARPNDASAEARLLRLESDLRLYRERYVKLEGLFLELAAVTRRLIAEGDAFAGEVEQFLRKHRELVAEVDHTLEESEAIIDFLKTKVHERPVLLIEAELAWHVLLGAGAGAAVVWEPLPWLGFKAGAALWYTDEIRPAFPLALRLRIGLE